METLILQGIDLASTPSIVQQIGQAIATGASQTTASISDLGSTASKLPQQAVEATSQRWITMFETMIETWMQNHPVVAWFLNHPIISVVLLLVLIVLLRGLLSAIARLTERIWIAILRLPVMVVSQSMGAITRLFNRPRIAATTDEEETSQKRLTFILERLDTLRQEQDELLQEVRTMLNSQQ